MAAIASGQKPVQASGQVVIDDASLLRNGIRKLPAIKKDGSPVVASIDASLADYDGKVLDAAEHCDKSLLEGTTKPEADKESWTRTVEVVMQGPHYITYVANDSYFCGGAYPDAGVFALVYDLQTGKLVDWTKLLPAATIHLQDNADGSQSQAVTSASLAKVYVANMLPKLDEDCADAIRNEDFASGFSLWPDAKAGSLVVHPNLSHAVAACGEDVFLNFDEQRSLGVAEGMIVALQAAHAALEQPTHK